jgi:cation transport ATPase
MLTLGWLVFVEEGDINDKPALSKSLLFGLLTNIKHPVSAADVLQFTGQGVIGSPIKNAKILTGKGAERSCRRKALQAGNPRWLSGALSTCPTATFETLYHKASV